MRLKAHLRVQRNDGTCLFSDDERQVTVFLHSDQWGILGKPQVINVTLEEAETDESG